jgi:hypothetical protein
LLHFSYLDPSKLGSKDRRTLLDYILAEAPQGRAVEFRERMVYESNRAFKQLLQRVLEIKARGLVPVLALDLDRVLFFWLGRDIAILKHYDQVRGTKYFQKLKRAGPLTRYRLKEFLYLHLEPQISDYEIFVRVYKDVNNFYFRNSWREEFMVQDLVNHDLIRRLEPLFRAGAQPLYLTSRMGWVKQATLRSLQASGLPEGDLILNEERASAAVFKVAQLEQYITEHPEVEIVGVLDDQRGNIEALQEKFPTQLHWRVHTRIGPRGELRSYLSNEAGVEHRVHGTRPKCDVLLLDAAGY